MPEKGPVRRRTFLAGSIAACTSLLGQPLLGQPSLRQPSLRQRAQAIADKPQTDRSVDRYKICAFVKFIQSLSYDRMAEVIAELGFDGIEATVRDRGHVLPERVEEDLPKLVEALKKHNLEVTVMASSVNRVDQPHTEKVLRTASKLGITCYRMAHYRYDLGQSVPKQLKEIGAMIKDLVAMHREFGMRAVYQNHSGARFVGAPIWDIHSLIKDYPVSDIGIAFDINHATVEGGLAWPLHFQLVKQNLGAVFIKDFHWEGRRARNVPLGTGRVDPLFLQQLKKTDFAGPLSLHVEYLEKAGVEKNIAALKQDLSTLRQWIASP